MKIENLKLKIIFFGTPGFVDPILNKLEENFEVVKAVRTPQQWNNRAIEQLASLSPDFFVVASFGQILPREVLSIPKLAAINIHPSLLPKYRGPSPIQSAILTGDHKTGVTFIKMDEEVDHGPIIEQFEVEILETDTFPSLAQKLFNKASITLVSLITRHDAIEKARPQDESKATYTKGLTRSDGYIDISDNIETKKLDKMIRAFYPWPGVWSWYNLSNKKVIVKLLPNKQIQVEGKRPMRYKDFVNGYPEGKVFLEKLHLI